MPGDAGWQVQLVTGLACRCRCCSEGDAPRTPCPTSVVPCWWDLEPTAPVTVASTEMLPQSIHWVRIHRRQWCTLEETQPRRWQLGMPSRWCGSKTLSLCIITPGLEAVGSSDAIIHQGCWRTWPVSPSLASPRPLALRHRRSPAIAFRIAFSLGSCWLATGSRHSPPPRHRFGGTVGFQSLQVQFKAEPGGFEGLKHAPHGLGGVLPCCSPPPQGSRHWIPTTLLVGFPPPPLLLSKQLLPNWEQWVLLG